MLDLKWIRLIRIERSLRWGSDLFRDQAGSQGWSNDPGQRQYN